MTRLGGPGCRRRAGAGTAAPREAAAADPTGRPGARRPGTGRRCRTACRRPGRRADHLAEGLPVQLPAGARHGQARGPRDRAGLADVRAGHPRRRRHSGPGGRPPCAGRRWPPGTLARGGRCWPGGMTMLPRASRGGGPRPPRAATAITSSEHTPWTAGRGRNRHPRGHHAHAQPGVAPHTDRDSAQVTARRADVGHDLRDHRREQFGVPPGVEGRRAGDDPLPVVQGHAHRGRRRIKSQHQHPPSLVAAGQCPALARISAPVLRPQGQANSKWSWCPPHQGTVVSAGRSASRSTGE